MSLKSSLAANYSFENLNTLHAALGANTELTPFAATPPAKSASPLAGQFEVLRGNNQSAGGFLSAASNAGIIIVGGKQAAPTPHGNPAAEAGIIIVGGRDAESSAGDVQSMKLQNHMDMRSKFLEALNNILNKMSKTSDTVVSNMK